MNTMLIIASIILVLIAGVATLFVCKQEERKMESYKQEHLSPEEARKRSQAYEETSVASVVPLQIWTYIITGAVTVLLIVMFMKFF